MSAADQSAKRWRSRATNSIGSGGARSCAISSPWSGGAIFCVYPAHGKTARDDAEELLDDVEDMLRTLLLCHLGQRSESAVMPYPAAWQRFSREGELSAMMRLLDAVAQARQMRANQVTWQAVVERLLLSLMEEKSKWST